MWNGKTLALAVAMISLGCHHAPVESQAPCGCETAGCVAVQAKEKTSSWQFRCRTDQKGYISPPRCSLLDWLTHSESAPPTCSGPVSRTVLIKHRVETETPTWKCEPVTSTP